MSGLMDEIDLVNAELDKLTAAPVERQSNIGPAEHAIGAGWMGTNGQMMHVLRTMGCDADEQGRLAVRGTISVFMGLSGPEADTVVGSDAMYRFHGKGTSHAGDFMVDCPDCRWASLAGALNGTSYGLRGVTVIG